MDGIAVAAVAFTPGEPAPVTELLANLPEGSSLSLILVPYPGGRALAPLPEVPASLSITKAEPGVALEANRAYFVRPDRPLVVKAGRFAAAPRGGQAGPTPLSRLFASVADELGPHAIGVLLSGTWGGGVDALRAIKEKGGTTIVQDPGTAVYDEGPRSAIAAGVVDHILAPPAIARELLRVASSAEASPGLSGVVDHPALDSADDGDMGEPFARILSLLKNKFRVDLGRYKLTTIRRRVERRMRLSHFDGMEAYADHLRANPEALGDLHDELFIHVTQFFRNPEAFDALKELVFPALLKARSADDPIRIWVPGCSTGEEPYSIAMALTEFLEQHGAQPPVQIFATDISDAAIQRARRAVYPERLLGEIGAERVERFFESTKEGFRIRKDVRELCIVSQHDVTSNPPFARLDLISCRNVFIYFGTELQRQTIPIFHYALKPGGFLWLGQSETPSASSKFFSLVDKQNKIYSKIPSPSAYLPLSSRLLTEKFQFARSMPRDPQAGVDFQKNADQLVLYKYGPPGVVVNYDLDVLQFRGRTAPFLAPSPGQPSHNLLKLAHPDLVPALRPLLQGARKQNLPVRKERLIIQDGARTALNVEVAPINPLAPERERQFLVLFEPIATDPAAMARTGRSSRGASRRNEKRARAGSREQYVEQLHQELEAARDYQQTLAEQFESAQEELTSGNEELQSTNEEFQSTIEELETAREELQSSNEELTTTNDELQSRNAELQTLYEKLARGEDRFRLMVESVKDYAIYMLDPDGRITSWNEGARRLKGYEASEIAGQHYSRFFTAEDKEAGAPEHELERARIDGRFEAEGWRVRKDGTQFWANIVVTRMNDSNGVLIGFSKVTRDLTERKRNQEELERTERRFQLMINGVQDYAIFTLDPEWRVASWNEGARRLKGYEASEITGRHFSIFYPPEDLRAGKIEREVTAVMADGRMEDEGWRVRKDGTQFWANVVITRVTDSRGNIIGFTKVTRDLTERRRAEQELRRANETLEARVRDRTRELEHALKTRDQFLSIASHELKTPLTGLKLQLQMARRNVERAPDGARPADWSTSALDRALGQAVALEELVEDLLDISRIQTGRFQIELHEVDLAGLVDEVAVRFAAQLAQARTTLELNVEAGLVGRWDERRIMQVFVNLISNALKYAPRSPIAITAARHGETARIVVEDSGPGISKERQGTIFERFERAGASPSVGGLGLGLFIVRRIVETHQGTIRVESEAGAGARFIIELPLEPGHQSPEAVPSENQGRV